MLGYLQSADWKSELKTFLRQAILTNLTTFCYRSAESPQGPAPIRGPGLSFPRNRFDGHSLKANLPLNRAPQ
jgi:hypothetical protein